MGLRFRKSIKVAPGVKVNLGKKSVGVSVGGKYGGVSFNSKTGARARVSAPGTGLSYSTKIGNSGSCTSSVKTSSSGNGNKNGSCLITCLKILGIILLFPFTLAFGWVAGIIWFIFYRKKMNDLDKQKKYTILIAIGSVISLLLFVSAMSSQEDNNNLVNTEVSTESTSNIVEETEISNSENDVVEEILATETESNLETEEIVDSEVQAEENQMQENDKEKKLVWTTDNAKKYHSRQDCSGMNDAYQITLDQAETMGKEPCGKCY